MIFYCFSIYFFLRPIWPSKPRRVKNVPRCLNEKRRDLKNQAPSLAAEDFYRKKKRETPSPKPDQFSQEMHQEMPVFWRMFLRKTMEATMTHLPADGSPSW